MFSISPYQCSVTVSDVGGCEDWCGYMLICYLYFLYAQRAVSVGPKWYILCVCIHTALTLLTTIIQTVRVEERCVTVDVKRLSRLTVQGTCLMFYRCYYTACSHYDESHIFLSKAVFNKTLPVKSVPLIKTAHTHTHTIYSSGVSQIHLPAPHSGWIIFPGFPRHLVMWQACPLKQPSPAVLHAVRCLCVR